jgi:hypothetical protein
VAGRPIGRVGEQRVPLVVDRLTARPIGDEERDLDDVARRPTRGSQHALDVGEDVGDLSVDRAGEFTGRRVHAHDPARHHQPTNPCRQRDRRTTMVKSLNLDRPLRHCTSLLA